MKELSRSILQNRYNFPINLQVVMYINSTSIPPIMIMNRMYENQSLLYIVPLTIHTIVVCISNINPMAKGCFICVNINLVIALIDISSFVMSGVFYLKC
jgi:hypothetical protein